jgi:DNA-binding LytR/AlgR family response regulator
VIPLKCLVVDDESLGRKLVEENIRQLPFLECVGTCKNAYEAMEVLQNQHIDLMFLDIQMPGMLGTTFLSTLRVKPMVIFVTAYDNYAVESYNLDVVDYLVKPVSMERFTRACYKALDVYKMQISALPVPPAHETAVQDDHFFVNVEYALVKVVISDITHIEGMKDYVKIYLASQPKPIITKLTLKNLEEKLLPPTFMRLHKSFIVRIDKIESIRNQTIYIGEHHIPVSQNHLDKLMESLKLIS